VSRLQREDLASSAEKGAIARGLAHAAA